ncbi:MAG TPA: hypothetical protein VMF69_17340 [Gemmataceae bacterium]|nr:hypothetical protein [Gemmataceae bacterium]
MSLASWFSAPKHHRTSALNKPGRQPRRWPTHSRPSLEYLEERTLLDASSGLIGGASGNLNLNSNFNLASSGNVLPIPTSGFNASADNGMGSQAATAALAAQDQPNSQFRLFGVNSQGENFQLIQQTTANILRDAYGFGSGTQPNAPWMPNAYNLGLANGQFGYSSQSDMGFSSAPPWSYPSIRMIPLAHIQPKEQFGDEDGKAPEKPEQMKVHKTWTEQEQKQQNWMDEDAGHKKEDLKEAQDNSPSQKQQVADEALLQPESSIPDSLLLSALSPAPMAALVAGLPGMAVPAEGGEGDAEVGEPAAAPE